MKKVLPILVIGWLVLLLVGITACGQPQKPVAPVEGAAAPEFSGTALNGETISLRELRGNPAVVTFWRSESPPALRELGILQELRAEKGDALGIISVNVKEDKARVEVLAKERKLTYPVILDPKLNLANLYKIDLMPTTFILDGSGIILKRANGGLTKQEILDVLK